MPHHTHAEYSDLLFQTLADLRAKWEALFNRPPPKGARPDYLVRAIAHHTQEKRHGALPPAAQRRIKKLIEGSISNEKSEVYVQAKLNPGARLLREWQGQTHEVAVVAQGYLYDAVVYKSLSEVARKITGTRWSGPLFFGLKQPKAQLSGKKPQRTFSVNLGCPPTRLARPLAVDAKGQGVAP